ncbi:MAG: class I SAM-dependent methyltransferase [Acidobacteria bacterium]|nr:class I SAM-dependent methyltransferase [Acidobacteriota bacterium]
MRVLIAASLFAILATPVAAQQFSPENLGPQIPTPQIVVDKMLEAGHVTADDVVYDLGSGDGRIVITAAQKYGARAVGIELLPDLCRKARERVRELGLGDRVSIIEGSALHADLSPATLVTMFFMTTSNERLRPALEKLKPGTRVVSNAFPIRGWKASEVVHVKEGKMEHTIYVYRIGETR